MSGILIPLNIIIEQVNKHHIANCTVFVLVFYRSEWPISAIYIEGIYRTNFLHDWVSGGQDRTVSQD
jgi:hypothetical protein